jgi:hypothetical protein
MARRHHAAGDHRLQGGPCQDPAPRWQAAVAGQPGALSRHAEPRLQYRSPRPGMARGQSRCQGEAAPREPRGRVRYLSEDERGRLLAACQASSDPRLFPLVVVALGTGARQGELLRLRWRDVDLLPGQATTLASSNPHAIRPAPAACGVTCRCSAERSVLSAPRATISTPCPPRREFKEGEFTADLALTLNARHDPLLVRLERAAWSPARATGGADSRTLTVLLDCAWIESVAG